MKRRPLLAALLSCTLAAIPAACARPPAAAAHRLLVKNALIFSMAAEETAPFHGYFSVTPSGRIDHIGHGTPPATLTAATIQDMQGRWIIPGFISAHSHLWQAAYRGLAPDQTLMGWIGELYGKEAPRAETQDFYWFTLYGSVDHLIHGVTAAYNFNLGRPPLTAQGTESIDQVEFRGEAASGIRFVHGIDPVNGADQSYDAASRHLKGFLRWVARQPGHERLLSVMLNGTAGFRDGTAEAAKEARLMHVYKVGNQAHYLEEPDKVPQQQARFATMQSTGLLGPTLIFGHFIHTTPEIIAQSAKAGASMVWNPLSNGRLASGVPDIPAYLKAGLPVGLGEDGEASADLADPFENMRTGLYAIRDKYESAAIMSPRDILRLHTLGSATVLGVADRLGSLEPGKYADFLVINPTHFGEVFNPYASLVFVASQTDLDAVYVGGEKKVEHGHLTGQDFDRIEAETTRRVRQSLTKPEPTGGWP